MRRVLQSLLGRAAPEGGTPEQESGTDRASASRGDSPSMLVIGESGPEVEDTTPQELARRAAQLERELAERRQQAEAEIAAKREEAERELRRRQLELDHQERTLDKAEAQKRRLQQRWGGPYPGAGRPIRSSGPSGSTGWPTLHRRRPSSSWVVWVASLVTAGTMGLAMTQVSTEVEDNLAELSRTQQDLVAWGPIILQLDEDVSRHLAGMPVETQDGQPLSVALAQQHAPAGRSGARMVERLAGSFPAAVADSSTPIRTLTTWEAARSHASDWVYTEATVVRTTLSEGIELRWFGAVAAAVALALMLALSLTSGAYPAAALAALGGVLAGVFLAVSPIPGSVKEAGQRQRSALLDNSQVVRQVEEDLAVAYGTSTRGGPDHWEEELYYPRDVPPDSPELADYVAARAHLGDVAEGPASGTVDDPEAVYVAGVALVEAGQRLLPTTVPAIEASTAHLARQYDGTTSPALPLLVGAGALALGLLVPFVDLLLSARRKEQS